MDGVRLVMVLLFLLISFEGLGFIFHYFFRYLLLQVFVNFFEIHFFDEVGCFVGSCEVYGAVYEGIGLEVWR